MMDKFSSHKASAVSERVRLSAVRSSASAVPELAERPKSERSQASKKQLLPLVQDLCICHLIRPLLIRFKTVGQN